MEKNVLIVLAVVSLFLVSCGPMDVIVPVLKGNYAYQRGEYQEATVNYLAALSGERYQEWIRYNLGNVYRALGEGEAALEMWNMAETAQNPQMLFLVHFNRGTLYFELGNYREAYEEFKRALELDHTSIDAKVNLEMSLEKIQAGKSGAVSPAKSQEDSKQKIQDNLQRILEYVRHKEGDHWASSRENPEDSQNNW